MNAYNYEIGKKVVIILMATYNGELYIRDQIDSIIKQTYGNWKLYIADDCSTDSTVQIVHEYTKLDGRIKFEINKDRRGPCQNFGDLLNKHLNEGDFFMFSDQDDIWDETKIEKSVFSIENTVNNKPLLVYSRKVLVNSNLEVIGYDRDSKGEIKDILCQNHIYGCTMFFNKMLAEVSLPVPLIATNHDYWIALCAVFFGEIILLDEFLMKYRVHSNNVTGGLNQYGLINKIRSWGIVNNKLKQKYRMCFYFSNKNFCKEAEMYKRIFTSRGIIKICNVIKFGYRADSVLGTVREYFLILFTKEKELVC